MTDFIKVEIPAKKYVKRFLEVRYGQPAVITKADAIGKFFYTLMSRPRQSDDKRFNTKTYPEYITIQLTQRVFLQRGYVLTPTNVIEFNNFVEDYIDLSLEYFVYGAFLMGRVKKAQAYREFLKRMKMTEDDFPFETIKKKTYRSGILANTRTGIPCPLSTGLQNKFVTLTSPK